MLVIAKYHNLLRRLDLDSLEGVSRFKGELIKNHKGRRDIQRVHAQDGPRKLTFFLKRNFVPYKKDGLKSLFVRGKVWSQSRVEWENALALQRVGISVAEPIAFGEECGLAWEKSSFILTAAAEGQLTLDSYLREQRDPEERRRVYDALARHIRKMHDAGYASPDLFTRHIFVDPSAPAFCLIDMARLNRCNPMSAALRARDLAALHVTAPLRCVTTRERIRFLRIYGGDSSLRKRALDRASHLLTRSKFADFLDKSGAVTIPR